MSENIRKYAICSGCKAKIYRDDDGAFKHDCPTVTDPVAHPSHYNKGKIEVIEFIEDQRLWFHLGNAVKYIARSAHKGKPVEDLRKAIWYIEREIELIQAEKEQREPCRPNDMGKKP